MREIVRMDRQRDVDVIVDIAQSRGQLDLRIPDLETDFVGVNLNKWVGAPLGTGFLYIRLSRLQDIGIQLGSREHPGSDILSRVASGTVDAAAFMIIPAALRFHAQVPLAERSVRLRILRDHWVHQQRDHAAVEVVTPDEAGSYGTVTSLRLRGRTSFEANVELVGRLADEHGIFTVARDGPLGGSCIRITPSYFTTAGQLDRPVAAVWMLAAR